MIAHLGQRRRAEVRCFERILRLARRTTRASRILCLAAAPLLLSAYAAAAEDWPVATFPLSAAPDGSHLVDADGHPFLVVGDAAWSAIVELTREEAELYLSDRKARGFNTLLVNLIEHRFSTHAPANEDGDEPFREPGRFDLINPAYFDHAAWFLETAEDMGFAVLLAPAYAGLHGDVDGWYKEMVAAGPDRLRDYAAFLATRFGPLQNLIWTHGGDYDVPDVALVDEMAKTFATGDPDALQTVHGSPGTLTSDVWAEAPWFSLDNAYTYGDVFAEVEGRVRAEHRLPVVMIESDYENEHGSDPQTLRAAAYESILAGGAGHVFGNNPIWHFSSVGTWDTSKRWRDELGAPGSQGMTHFRAFFETLPWWTLRSDEGLLCGLAAVSRRVACGRSSDGRLAVVYATEGPLQLDLSVMIGAPLCPRWFDPSAGAFHDVEGSPWNVGATRVAPLPASRNAAGDRDWLLLLHGCDD